MHAELQLIERFVQAMASEAMGGEIPWDHSAGVTKDIESLRAICLKHADVWNAYGQPLYQLLQRREGIFGADVVGHQRQRIEELRTALKELVDRVDMVLHRGYVGHSLISKVREVLEKSDETPVSDMRGE